MTTIYVNVWLVGTNGEKYPMKRDGQYYAAYGLSAYPDLMTLKDLVKTIEWRVFNAMPVTFHVKYVNPENE